MHRSTLLCQALAVICAFPIASLSALYGAPRSEQVSLQILIRPQIDLLDIFSEGERLFLRGRLIGRAGLPLPGLELSMRGAVGTEEKIISDDLGRFLVPLHVQNIPEKLTFPFEVRGNSLVSAARISQNAIWEKVQGKLSCLGAKAERSLNQPLEYLVRLEDLPKARLEARRIGAEWGGKTLEASTKRDGTARFLLRSLPDDQRSQRLSIKLDHRFDEAPVVQHCEVKFQTGVRLTVSEWSQVGTLLSLLGRADHPQEGERLRFTLYEVNAEGERLRRLVQSDYPLTKNFRISRELSSEVEVGALLEPELTLLSETGYVLQRLKGPALPYRTEPDLPSLWFTLTGAFFLIITVLIWRFKVNPRRARTSEQSRRARFPQPTPPPLEVGELFILLRDAVSGEALQGWCQRSVEQPELPPEDFKEWSLIPADGIRVDRGAVDESLWFYVDTYISAQLPLDQARGLIMIELLSYRETLQQRFELFLERVGAPPFGSISFTELMHYLTFLGSTGENARALMEKVEAYLYDQSTIQSRQLESILDEIEVRERQLIERGSADLEVREGGE